MYNYYVYEKKHKSKNSPVNDTKSIIKETKSDKMIKNHYNRLTSRILSIADNPEPFSVHDNVLILNSRENFMKEKSSGTSVKPYKVHNYVNQAHKAVWDLLPDKHNILAKKKKIKEERLKALTERENEYNMTKTYGDGGFYLPTLESTSSKEAYNTTTTSRFRRVEDVNVSTEREKNFKLFAKNPYASNSDYYKNSAGIYLKKEKECIAPFKSIVQISMNNFYPGNKKVITYGKDVNNYTSKVKTKKSHLSRATSAKSIKTTATNNKPKSPKIPKIQSKLKRRLSQIKDAKTLIEEASNNFSVDKENNDYTYFITDKEKQILMDFVMNEDSVEILKTNPSFFPVNAIDLKPLLKDDNDETFNRRFETVKALAYNKQPKRTDNTSFLKKLRSKAYKMKRAANQNPIEYFLRFNKAAMEDLRKNDNSKKKSDDDVWLGGKVFHKTNIPAISKELLRVCNIISSRNK